MINFIKNLLCASNNDADILNNQNYDDEIYWSEIEEKWADYDEYCQTHTAYRDDENSDDLPW